MHSQLHELFVSWVKERRGDRLTGTEDLFTGDVWLGAKAQELGLIDGLGSLRQMTITERYPDADISVGPRAEAAVPRPPRHRSPGGGIGRIMLLGLAQAADIRATWARYGL